MLHEVVDVAVGAVNLADDLFDLLTLVTFSGVETFDHRAGADQVSGAEDAASFTKADVTDPVSLIQSIC